MRPLEYTAELGECQEFFTALGVRRRETVCVIGVAVEEPVSRSEGFALEWSYLQERAERNYLVNNLVQPLTGEDLLLYAVQSPALLLVAPVLTRISNLSRSVFIMMQPRSAISTKCCNCA